MSQYLSPAVYPKVTNASQMASLATSTTFAVVVQATRGRKGTQYISSSRQLLNQYGNPNQGRAIGLWAALEVLKQRGAIWVNNVSGEGETTAYLKFAETGTGTAPTPAAAPDPTAVAWDPTDVFRVQAAGPGSYYGDIGVRITGVDERRKLVTLGVFNRSNSNFPIESWTFAMKPGLSAGGVQQYAEDVVNRNSQYISLYVNPGHDPEVLPTPSEDIYYLTGGDDGEDATPAAVIAGWQEFANKNKYDVTILINAGYATPEVHTAMVQVAAQRFDALAILDLPANILTAEGAVNYRTETLGLYSRFGALYGPRYKLYSPYEDRVVSVPASVGVAAAAAYSDSVKDVWWAVAGANRGLIPGALGLDVEWEQLDQDLLYPESINAIVNEPGIGIMINGNRTLLQDDSALWSINVHRLVCAVVKSASAYLRYSLFELNTDALGRAIETNLSDMLEMVRGADGVYRYAVVSNGSNNSNYDIDQLIRNVDVHIQPTRTAEFIVLNTIVTRTGVEFNLSSTTDSVLA